MIKVERWLNHDIRFVSNGNEWQAIAKDIADALEYSDANKMLKRIERKYQDSYKPSDEDILKIKDDHQNGGQFEKFNNYNYTTLTELGIYKAIMRSNKPQAKAFQDWIYTTIQKMRQAQGLEQYQAFKMLDKTPSKKDLTTEQLAKREEILNATIKLIITKETLQLDNLHVSKVIYQKYSN